MPGLLAQRVKAGSKALQKGPGGVLQEVQPELQQLTGRAGLPVPPTSALQAATIGANTHQQKMVGSPAQTGAAMRVATGEQNLQTAERVEDQRAATERERRAVQRSEQLTNLGSLGDRVSDFMEGQRAAFEKATQPVEVQSALPASVQGISALPPDSPQLAGLKQALSNYRKNPQDMQSLLLINQTLGRDINSVLAP